MNKYERTQIVRTYECDANLRLKPESILHWVQDIAEEHAATLEFGYDMCMRNGLAWVEVKLLVQIRRMPSWKEQITVRTWTYPQSAVIAGREFDMLDSDGNTIIEVSTQWVLIDIQKRRPVALKKHLSFFTEQQEEQTTPLQMEDIPAVEMDQPIATYRAEYHTVDFNHHVNNGFYLLWALDALPGDCQSRDIKTIRIDFKKESMPMDVIDIYAESSEACSVFTLSSDNTERARVSLAWAD